MSDERKEKKCPFCGHLLENEKCLRCKEICFVCDIPLENGKCSKCKNYPNSCPSACKEKCFVCGYPLDRDNEKCSNCKNYPNSCTCYGGFEGFAGDQNGPIKISDTSV